MAHVGIECLHSGKRQHNISEIRPGGDAAVVEEVVDVFGIPCVQYGGGLVDSVDSDRADRKEVQQHDWTEKET